MIVNQYTDEELRQLIIQLAEQNNIDTMYNHSPSKMADSFLAYTKIILDWYSGIAKNGFERKYFYIAGIDAALAMMILGYKVNSDRRANVVQASMDRLDHMG